MTGPSGSSGTSGPRDTAAAGAMPAGRAFPPPPRPPGEPPSGPPHGDAAFATPADSLRDADNDPAAGMPDVGWLGDVSGLFRSARGMLQGRLLLLALELQRAQRGLVLLAVLGVIAAIAGATAWLALWAGAVALAVHLGLALPWACAGVLVINVLLLLWVLSAMKSVVPLVALPASRRQFHWLFNDPRDAEDDSQDGRSPPSA